MLATSLLVVLGGLLGQAAPVEGPALPRVVGRDVKEPRKVKNVPPKYPEDARRAGLAGRVILECTLGPEGDVQSISVNEGPRVLSDAAVEAVRQWRYTPTLLDGVAVPVIMTVTVNFKMDAVAYDGLMTSLRHRDESIRAAAARNLGGLRRSSLRGKGEMRDAIVELEGIVEHDPSARVRAAAAEALSALDGRPLPAAAPPEAPARPGPTEAATRGGARPVAWGSFVDPLGQCEIVESGSRLEMSVPAGAYDLSIELGQVTAPRLVRVVEGDHEAQVTVDELPEPGQGPPDQPRRPFHGAGLLLWKDERASRRL